MSSSDQGISLFLLANFDDENRYDAAAQKFKSIFEINEDEDVHYIPGNEDVG